MDPKKTHSSVFNTKFVLIRTELCERREADPVKAVIQFSILVANIGVEAPQRGHKMDQQGRQVINGAGLKNQAIGIRCF